MTGSTPVRSAISPQWPVPPPARTGAPIAATLAVTRSAIVAPHALGVTGRERGRDGRSATRLASRAASHGGSSDGIAAERLRHEGELRGGGARGRGAGALLSRL